MLRDNSRVGTASLLNEVAKPTMLENRRAELASSLGPGGLASRAPGCVASRLVDGVAVADATVLAAASSRQRRLVRVASGSNEGGL